MISVCVFHAILDRQSHQNRRDTLVAAANQSYWELTTRRSILTPEVELTKDGDLIWSCILNDRMTIGGTCDTNIVM